EKAVKYIDNAAPDVQFIILDHTRKNIPRPINKNEALAAVKEIKAISLQPNIEQILAVLSSAAQQNNATAYDVFFFSDMQKNIFEVSKKTLRSDDNIQLHFIPIQEQSIGNVYIDTAYFTSPNIDINN